MPELLHGQAGAAGPLGHGCPASAHAAGAVRPACGVEAAAQLCRRSYVGGAAQVAVGAAVPKWERCNQSWVAREGAMQAVPDGEERLHHGILQPAGARSGRWSVKTWLPTSGVFGSTAAGEKAALRPRPPRGQKIA